jgi:ankyrin repeat protein
MVDINSPLVFAIRYDRVEIVKLLISAGAELNRDMNGVFPLIFALLHQNGTIIETLLLRFPSEIHKRYSENKTLLHIMCGDGCPLSVDILLRLGIDFTIQDQNGKTAKDYAMAGLNCHSDEYSSVCERIVNSINAYETADIKEPEGN